MIVYQIVAPNAVVNEVFSSQKSASARLARICSQINYNPRGNDYNNAVKFYNEDGFLESVTNSKTCTTYLIVELFVRN
jgi:hypothetical protein